MRPMTPLYACDPEKGMFTAVILTVRYLCYILTSVPYSFPLRISPEHALH